ncbi:MAG: 60S ribosomal protein L31 [Thermoprotei archaeon]|nr:60S ribosomal protein L31 [Thermoprotei archaeon]
MSKEDKVVLERVYLVPLSDVYETCRLKRAARAVRELRAFILRHMKGEGVVIDPQVNEFIWSRGREKPPRYVKVKAKKYDDGRVEVSLAE